MAGRAAVGGGRLDAAGGVVRTLLDPEPVYNIEVEGDHCYRVGQQGLLVHNNSGGEGATSGAQSSGVEGRLCRILGNDSVAVIATLKALPNSQSIFAGLEEKLLGLMPAILESDLIEVFSNRSLVSSASQKAKLLEEMSQVHECPGLGRLITALKSKTSRVAVHDPNLSVPLPAVKW